MTTNTSNEVAQAIAEAPTAQGTNVMCLGTATAFEQSNEALLDAAWIATGKGPKYPVDTDTAFQLLQSMGFEPTRVRLRYQIEDLAMEKPSVVDDIFQWDRESILRFADALDASGHYLPGTTIHSHKLTEEQRATAKRLSARKDMALNAFRNMSLNSLLKLMTATEHELTRTWQLVVIHEKLGWSNSEV